MPVTAVQILNNHVPPFFDEHRRDDGDGAERQRPEYGGREDRHPYELFLQVEEIEHRRTKVGRPQSNCFIERFHRTLLDEHLRVKGRTTCTSPSRRCRRIWTPTSRPTQDVLIRNRLRAPSPRCSRRASPSYIDPKKFTKGIRRLPCLYRQPLHDTTSPSLAAQLSSLLVNLPCPSFQERLHSFRSPTTRKRSRDSQAFF